MLPSPVARPDAGFLEIGQGEWEGLHRDEITARYGDTLAAWRRTPTQAWAPGGESLAEVAGRVRPALAGVLATLAEGGTPGSLDRNQVAGYGDEGPCRAAVVDRRRPRRRVQGQPADLVRPAARAVLDVDDGPRARSASSSSGPVEPVLRAHNLTGHLAALLDEAAQEAQEARSRSGAL